jgi:hypothetical protein
MRNLIGNSYSAIVGGQGNLVNGQYSGITGGLNNYVFGRMSIASGELDSITSDHSVISGGYDNAIIGASAIAQYSAIGGGRYQSIRTGVDNTLSGGSYNLIMLTDSSAISGGSYNRILTQSDASYIGGGINNLIQTNAILNTISGGRNNTITNTDSSTIGGGASNSIVSDADGSTIGGGISNSINSAANSAFIGGGLQNAIAANGQRSVIGGGYLNDIADADYAVVVGGNNNNIGNSSNYSVIVSGNINDISTSAVYSMIGTGQDNNIGNGSYSYIGSGNTNDIGNANYAYIGSGNNNNIGANSTASFIGSGEANDIGTAAYQSVIVGGIDNNIADDGQRSAIVGGYLNNIADADYSVVAGGYNNNIAAYGNHSAIVGGSGNTVSSNADYSAILGGLSNRINTSSDASVVGGGQNNEIAINSYYSALLGGNSNYVSGNYSSVVAGDDNTVNGDDSFIGGGYQNSITGHFNTVLGGQANAISTSKNYSSIAGGRDNAIQSNYAFAAGYSNFINADYGVAIGNDNTVTGSSGVAIGVSSSAAASALALGTSANAVANQMDAYFSAGFKFRGEGTAEGAHTATFYNPSASGNGVKIRINAANPVNANNFVTFTNSSDVSVGRIEGQASSAEFTNSDQYNRELALYNYIIDMAQGNEDQAETQLAIGISGSALEAVHTGLSWADVGARAACGSSPFTLNCVGLSAAGVAYAVANVAKLAKYALDIASFVTQYTAAQGSVQSASELKQNWTCNRNQNIVVTYESGAGDYAEWLPKSDIKEKFIASDIVGVKNGRITKNTSDIDQTMVISMKPIVLGNTPDQGREKEFEKVAFMGQVPVRVIGKVNLGDFILPSGGNNGLGIAKNPRDMSPMEYRKIVGVAWTESKSETGVNVINVAVGLNHNATAGVIEAQNTKLSNIEKELDETKANIEKINTALVSLVPAYQNVMKIQNNKGIQEIFKGLDYDKPKVVTARQLKQYTPFEGVLAEQVKDAPKAGTFIPLEDMEKGYQLARQKVIEAGGDPETDPFYSRMDRDPVYKELMLTNINRMINKNAVETIIKQSND